MSPPVAFRVLVITDWTLGAALFDRLDRALAAGPGLAVQHRNPGATTRDFYRDGERLAALCARHGAPLFVNGRLDVALGLGAHLHLPAHGLRPADVRPHLPPGRWLSVAVHDAAEASRAGGADLALVSPVFSPGSKPTDPRPQLGPEGFRALAAALPCPAFALGGLTAQTARALAPLAGAAVISAVLRADDPGAAAAALLRSLSPAPEAGGGPRGGGR